MPVERERKISTVVGIACFLHVTKARLTKFLFRREFCFQACLKRFVCIYWESLFSIKVIEKARRISLLKIYPLDLEFPLALLSPSLLLLM